MSNLKVEYDQEADGILTIKLIGKLDTETSPTFHADIDSILARKARSVILDLAELDYISSAGLRAILTLRKSLTEQNIKLKLSNAHAPVQEVLDLAGIFEKMDVFSKEKSADVYLDAVQRREKYKDSDYAF